MAETSSGGLKPRGLLGLLGGSLIHLSCGSMYCWGNLLSYMPPELKYWGGAAAAGSVPDAQFVLAFTILSQMVGMPIGPALERAGLGPRRTALLGALLMGSGVLLASFATSLATFVPCYCVLFGLGVGIAYQMPILNGAKWFPKAKGAVSGVVIFGMGASAFFFNMLATRIVNPSGLNPGAGGLFPAAVYARWPGLLRVLGSIYLAVGLLGALLQSPPASEPEAGAAQSVASWYDSGLRLTSLPSTAAVAPPPAAAPSTPAATAGSGNGLLADVTSRSFVTMWSMIIFSAIGGLNTASSYKLFGVARAHLNADAFLSLVGGLASLLGNAAGRIFWGTRSDARGFRRTFFELTALQSATLASYVILAKTRLGFACATVLMLFCMGGNFAMFAAQALRCEWRSSASGVYGFMFSAFAVAALGGPYVTGFLIARGGIGLVFGTLSCASLVAMALGSTLPESGTGR